MAEQISGHCLCGAVQIQVIDPKSQLEICHCNMCRRWGGAFYAALVPGSFAIQGEDAVHVYRSSNWTERAFCRHCGSNLWYEFLPTASRSFLAGLFDEAVKYGIEREIFVDERANWSDGSGDHPRLTGEEVIREAKEAGFTFD